MWSEAGHHRLISQSHASGRLKPKAAGKTSEIIFK